MSYETLLDRAAGGSDRERVLVALVRKLIEQRDQVIGALAEGRWSAKEDQGREEHFGKTLANAALDEIVRGAGA